MRKVYDDGNDIDDDRQLTLFDQKSSFESLKKYNVLKLIGRARRTI